jgi:hypothetical protein
MAIDTAHLFLAASAWAAFMMISQSAAVRLGF